MEAVGAGLLARQKDCSHLDAFRAERQGGGDAPRICDTAGGDHRHADGVDDLGDQRNRAGE